MDEALIKRVLPHSVEAGTVQSSGSMLMDLGSNYRGV